MSIVSTVNLYVLPFSKRILEFPACRSCICSVIPLSPKSWIKTFPSVPSPSTSPIFRHNWYATTAAKHSQVSTENQEKTLTTRQVKVKKIIGDLISTNFDWGVISNNQDNGWSNYFQTSRIPKELLYLAFYFQLSSWWFDMMKRCALFLLNGHSGKHASSES